MLTPIEAFNHFVFALFFEPQTSRAESNLVGTRMDRDGEVARVTGIVEEPPPEQEAIATVQAEGRPPPPVRPKWKFNLDRLDTPLTQLPPVSSELEIMKPPLSDAFLSIIGGMVTCMERHGQGMAG